MTDKLKLLFISAVVKNDLQIDLELKRIQEQVRQSTYRDLLEIAYKPASTFQDVIRSINEMRPEILHFSGHGEIDSIILLDEFLVEKRIKNTLISELLASCPVRPKLLVFNCCESVELARDAVQYCDAAVGMTRKIKDSAAIEFAGQIYSSIGNGLPLGKSIDQAILLLKNNRPEQSEIPCAFFSKGMERAVLLPSIRLEGTSGAPEKTPMRSLSVVFDENGSLQQTEEEIVKLISEMNRSVAGEPLTVSLIVNDGRVENQKQVLSIVERGNMDTHQKMRVIESSEDAIRAYQKGHKLLENAVNIAL